MKLSTFLLIASTLLLSTFGCGSGQDQRPACFLGGRDTTYVANAGSSTISGFQEISASEPFGPAAGSPFSMGAPPTSLAGDGIRGFGFVVASRTGKTISEFRVDICTGSLSGPLFTTRIPMTPVAIAEWRSFFYVANLEGGVSGYQVGTGHVLTEIPGSPFPAGSGPISLQTAEPGVLYVANSISNDVSGFLLNATTGALTPLPGSPYPAGTSPAWVAVSPATYPAPVGGPTLVIVANSGSNDVSVYTIAGNGALGEVPGSPFAAGDGPSSIGINDYTFPLKFLYVGNSRSNNISGFSIDQSTGVLTPLPRFPVAAGRNPSSLAMSGGDGLLFAANAGSNSLSVFHIDINTGALTPFTGSPFPVGQSPRAVLYFQAPQ